LGLAFRFTFRFCVWF